MTNEDKIAVVDQNGQRQTTYKEFFTMACRVAGYLQQKNYPPHSFIGICLPSSMEYVAAEIGIWLAGHAIVPMGDKYPKDRIDYIMHHCESPLLINDDVMQTIKKTEPAENYVLPNEEDINALFYTSGSTGVPKAVMTTFTFYRISPTYESFVDEQNVTVMGITAPMFFVVSKQLYIIIVKGGIANLIPAETIKDIRKYETYLTKHQIEFVFMPPSLLAHFQNKSSHLKIVTTGAERLSGVGPSNYKIYNCYGQTETGGFTFSFLVDKKYENTPIGKPDVDVEYCILDTEGKPVAPGEEGELCVRGPFTSGYYKEPELTENLFRGGWLHTGDIVCQQPDGNVIYVNRKDWMVKINGQRVEPGEVEAVIKQIDGIKNAIVKGFITKDRQFLCAYYIANDNISDDSIREYLRSKLPSYMVPAYFVKMDSFPLLPSGKTDRKALLAPSDKTKGIVRPPYAEPTNSIELQLCEAFEKALSIDRVGIDDDFFELGGDSIRVMEVQTLCPDLALSSQMIYANRTPKKIAEACAKTEQVNFAKQKDYPLSQTQLGIYVECMSQQEETLYNNAILFKLADDIDTNRLAHACEAVVEAHPYIKTRLFVDEEGHPRQRRNDEVPYHQQVESMSETDFLKLRSQLEQPFQLHSDQLFRIRILKTTVNVYLFIDFHHIIFDGTSMQILLQDISSAYEANVLQKETWSGFEVAQEEETMRLTENYTKAAEWNKSVFGILDVTSLPIPDNNSEQVSIGKYAHLIPIDQETLEQSCRRLGITAQVLTTAAFGYLLGAFTHNREALFATVYNGRNDLKTQRTVAMMVKTIAVHTSWNENLTIREWLQQVKEILLGSMNHDLYSFAELCALNNHVNSEVLFAYQGGFQTTLAIDGHVSHPQSLTKNATGKCLFMELLPDARQLQMIIAYQENRYSEFFIKQFAQCYEQIICQLIAVDNETTRLIDLPLLTTDEYDQQKKLGAGKKMLFDKSETVVSLFCKKAKEQPDSPALVFKDKCYSYQELDSITDHLAAYLADHYQVKPEETVGVMIDRSDLMVIYPLAIMKMGAAYMPLDYQFPADRLQYMCEDTGVRLILSEGNRVSKAMPDFHGEVWTDEQLNNLPETTTVLVGPQPDQHYVVLYTSGSTGLPKGVVLEHHSMVNFCHWYSEEFGLRTDDRAMAYANFSFDAHMLEIYPALTAGSCVYVIPSDMRLDLPLLNNYMEEQGITVVFMTTQVGYLFATTIENHSLRVLLFGGEKFKPITAPSSYITYNVYGPTECTLFTSYYRMDGYCQRQLIGRPLSNYQLYVVNPDLQLVPQGAVGELIVLGEGLARGYLHPADKDKGKFTMFGNQRCYKTGDLVRWTNSGDLEYVERIDNQVKLRGLRIELEEIELRALQHPLISQAVARVTKVGGVENLCLYYVAKEADITIETEDLKSFLSEKLVDFMVPTVMMQLDSIPMTPNGKINRKALPVPTVTSETHVAPETEMEKQVLELVAKMLKTTQIGVTDNLLHWGLSSLAAMRLSSLLQRRFEVYVKIVEILKRPTVRAIASLLSKASDSSLPVYEPRPYYPLMENQRGLYLEWKKNPDTTQYNIPFVYSFEGIDTDRMVNALKQVVNAHPYLKSKLIEVDGEVVLQRHDQESVEIKVSELSEEPENAYFQKHVLPFHLLGDPLYRLEVLKTPHKAYLFFDVHHIIFDGLSRDVFMKDLKRAYEGEILKQESYQAYDYALYEQAELSNTEKTQKAESWYDELLSGANAIVLPSYLAPDGVDFAHIEVSLPSHQIETFCAVNGITVNSYMHAAFAIFVKRLIKEENPLYLTISNGRDAGADLQQCIGMFVKTMPIVITSELVQGLSTADFVKEIHEQLQKSYSMDYYPYTQIVARRRVNAELMFLYQDEVGKNHSWENVAQIPLSLDTTKFPISIIITPEANNYHVTLEYDGKRYNSQGMRHMVNAFRNVLLNMTVTATVFDIEQISPDEKSELLKLSKGETIEYDQSETFVDLFQRQVAISPEAIAVVDSLGSMTYQELDNQSNILAKILVDQGVVKDDFVGIMLPRCKEFLVAVLGVFKAGGAYIPLDPEYPEAHLSYILDNAQTKLLLSTSSLVQDKSFNGKLSDRMLFINDIDFNCESVSINKSHPNALAYMIYTSGSTGKPKGVMMEHKGLCALMKWLVPMEELNPGDKCAEHASFSFDASLLDLFPPLTCGAEVHILSSKLRLDTEGMCQYFREQHITGISISTQLGMEMINGFELPLRYMVMGGEKMKHLRKTSVKLINEYGPTEFTVCSSYHIVNQDKDVNVIPIGRPVPNSMSVIVDNMGHLVPQGIPGELCLIGRQMSRGYWRQTEQTASHFSACPFLEGESMYHTGDMARWNDDGELVYLGRTDSQVKFNGFRIELSEIENVMMAYPSVTAAAVLVFKRKDIKTLVGYFCAEVSIDTQAILHHLSTSLPQYMIPQMIIQIDKMPITPNGKIDKKALLSDELMSGRNMGELILPANENEKMLYGIVKEVLEREDFGVTDDLSLLGLTSLSAIKLAELANREGLSIKVNDILRSNSIRDILINEQSVGKWENGYDTSKPVVVIVQGFTYYKKLEPLINKLCRHYSVFVIEPIDDHYEAIFNEDNLSCNDVVDFYLDYLEASMRPNINVAMFIGHSFGGELAYRCAVRWHKKTGTWPKVCMLDSFAHVANIAKEMPIPEIESPTPDEAADIEEIKEWNRHLRQMQALKEDRDLSAYDGDVLYFKAEDMSMQLKTIQVDVQALVQKKQADLNSWSMLAPRISIYPVAAGHLTMLDEQFCNDYISKIDNIV
jgi:amino acid adenylation domain-containing protein